MCCLRYSYVKLLLPPVSKAAHLTGSSATFYFLEYLFYKGQVTPIFGRTIAVTLLLQGLDIVISTSLISCSCLFL